MDANAEKNFGTVFGAAFLILSGLFLVLFGSRLVRIAIFIAGGFFLSSIAYLILMNIEPESGFDNSQLIYIIVMAVTFVIGGGLANFFYKLGIFLLGAAAGWLLVLFFSALVAIPNPWGVVVMIIALLVGGIVAVKWEQKIMAVATSAIGAAGVILGIDIFADADVWFNVNDVLRFGGDISADRGVVVSSLDIQMTSY